MENEWIQLLTLLRLSVAGDGGSDLPRLADADWALLFRLAKAHSIAATVAGVVRACGCPADICADFDRARNKSIWRSAMFAAEREKVLGTMDSLGICHILLKGIAFDRLYPRAGMREFADCDILISPGSDSDALRAALVRDGYELTRGPVHDSYRKAPCFNFEIHKTLFLDEYGFSAYFNGIFDRAEKVGPYEYRMTDDDFYCYYIAHLYKHHRSGGFGLRSLTDLWLLQRDYRARGVPVNRDLLQRLGLADFEAKLTDLARRTSEEADGLSCGDADIAYIFRSGTYGSVGHSVDNGIREKGRARYFLRRLFPPLSVMKIRYPVLVRLPVLLPFCHAARLVRGVFKREARHRFGITVRKVFGR